jgi:hypothetical protein
MAGFRVGYCVGLIRRLALPLFLLTLAVAAGRLPVGDALPSLGGETLSGKQVELPGASAGTVPVLVFSFTKAAGSDSRLWNQRLAKDFGSNSAVAIYRVAFLESAPKLFRGMAVSGMKSGVPEAQWERTLVVLKDEDAWKQRLGVSSNKHAYVVVLDGQGRVRWMSAGPFSESEYGQLKSELSR